MKTYFIHSLSIFLFTLLILVASCKGQGKTGLSKEPVAEQLSFTSRQPKLTKTQGTDQGQNVHDALQDKNGNLWFGTTGEGVYRYDARLNGKAGQGKLFTQFTEKDGLSDNNVWAMLEDRLGNIWFGTNKGISRYDGKTISMVSMSLNKNGNLFTNTSSNNAVWNIMQDKNGIIWFGTDSGIYCYNGKTFSRFLDKPGIINKSKLTLKSVQCMFEDKKGNLWFGSGPMTFEGIVFYDGKTLTNFKLENEGWIRKITQDKNGALLFDTRHIGVITYDEKKFSPYPEPPQLIKELLNTILVDSKGNIWYGSDYTNNDITSGDLWKFDGKTFVEFTKKDGLSNTAVYTILEDRGGSIWIGTRNTGLYRYDGKTFTNFSETGIFTSGKL